MSPCTCRRLKVGLTVTDARDWDCECPLHGTGSQWWNDPERVAKREADRLRLIDLQRRAREARQSARANQQVTSASSADTTEGNDG